MCSQWEKFLKLFPVNLLNFFFPLGEGRGEGRRGGRGEGRRDKGEIIFTVSIPPKLLYSLLEIYSIKDRRLIQ